MILLLQCISRALAWLPVSAALAVGRSLGWFMGAVVRYRRRDASEALQQAFPELDAAARAGILARMYKNLGMTVVEQLRISVLGLRDFEDRINVLGIEHYRSSLARSNGSLALMAHLGNWELCGYSTRLVDRRITVVVKPMKNKKFEAYLTRTRERMGFHLLPVTSSYRECLRRLRKAEVVGMILDQNTHRHRGVFVDFFGRTACTTQGLAILSAQSQSPVIPVFVVRRDDNRYDMIIHPAIDPPPNRDADTMRQATQDYTRIIEDMIRRYPDQWIWIHRRWRTRPKPEPTANPPTTEDAT